LVNELFSVIEVLDFSLEVINLSSKLGKEVGKSGNLSVGSFEVVSLVDEVTFDLTDEGFEVVFLGNEFVAQLRSLIGDILDGFLDQLDNVIDLTTGSQMEFDCGNNLLGDLGFLSNEYHSFDSNGGLGGFSTLSERNSGDSLAADQSQQ